ncbi:DUF4244 domain-containing protein [Schumannella luteola]|nr:DUF4244 domain-containing protein [Schumannella luteola]
MPASRAAAVAPTPGPASAVAFAPERWIAPQRGGIRARLADDGGAATAEYAITIMAAVGFAGLLVVILKSGEVQKILTDLVHKALTVAG